MSEVIVEGQSGSRQMTVSIGSLRFTVDRAADEHELRSVDFMLAALGSCTLATIGHYIARKGHGQCDIKIKIDTSRSDGEDKYTKIGMVVELGPEVEDQIKLMLPGISKSCTIHKTITGAPEIIIDVV